MLRSMEPPHLITTSDERTWPLAVPILFLGDQCLRYDRKKLWKSLVFSIEPNYESNPKNQNIIVEEVRLIQKMLFPKLVEILNCCHQTSFSESFWKIFVGPWFERFLYVIVTKKNALESVIEYNQIQGATFINFDDYFLIPKDLIDMYRLHSEDSYNSCLDGMLIPYLKNIKFPVTYMKINFEKSEKYLSKLKHTQAFFGIRWLKKLFSHIGSLIVRDNEPFMITTYLPLLVELKLQAAFFIFPKIWKQHITYEVTKEPNSQYRTLLSKEMEILSGNNLISNFLFKLIPICYLEGFDELLTWIEKSNFPREPKFIFTSNDFQFNEVFKLYSAICQEKGIKYFIGQHGNQYGTNKFFSPTLEEETSSQFITWGWGNNSAKYLPGFIFNTVGKDLKIFNQGGLLLVQYPFEHLNHGFASYFDINKNIADCVHFIQTLEQNPFDNLTVRFISNHGIAAQYAIGSLIDFSPDLTIDQGDKKLSSLMLESRLIVFAYDSTGILENLAMDIPTLAFWQFEMQHLTEEAKGYYQILVDVGIVHFHPESIANKVNEIWSDVESWWRSPVIQIAREKFCYQYARTSHKPIRDLKRIIRANL